MPEVSNHNAIPSNSSVKVLPPTEDIFLDPSLVSTSTTWYAVITPFWSKRAGGCHETLTVVGDRAVVTTSVGGPLGAVGWYANGDFSELYSTGDL